MARNVKEKRPEVGGRFLIFTPPISNDVQLFSGGFGAVSRGASDGPTTAEGWLAATAGIVVSEIPVVPFVPAVEFSASLGVPFGSGLGRLGFVIGIADFATVREAMALARARWCGERDWRIIYKNGAIHEDSIRIYIISITYFTLEQLVLPMLSHDWLCPSDAPWGIVLRAHRVLILLVGWGRYMRKRVLVMVVCLDGHVGMRCWKAVKVIYVSICEERIAW